MPVLKLPTLLIPLVRRLLLIEQTCNIRIFASSIYLKHGVQDSQWTYSYKSNIEARPYNNCCRGKCNKYYILLCV